MLVNESSKLLGNKDLRFHCVTPCVGSLVQICDEFAPRLLISSQSEGVGQQGGGVQVVQLAGQCCLQTVQAVLYHGVLSHHRDNTRMRMSRGGRTRPTKTIKVNVKSE